MQNQVNFERGRAVPVRLAPYLAGFLITLSGSAGAKQEALFTDPHCQLFSRLQTEPRAEIRKQLVQGLAVSLKERDPQTLRARAEVARRGLYGFKIDLKHALKLYLFSAEKGSPVSAYNASLLLYQQIKSRPNAMIASKIIKILALAKIDEDEPQNEAAARGYFILGEIYRHGWTTGQQDLKKAFFHYQKSARKNFFPAVYPYLSLMAGSMNQFDENERLNYQNEMRKLLDRWKWVSIEVMDLAGDIYGSGILPDDGVMAQFHWRLAMHMRADGASKAKVHSAHQRQLDPILEKRVERMIRRTLAQRPQLGKELANRSPAFMDLCSPSAKN